MKRINYSETAKEAAEQEALFEWAKLMTPRYPELRYMYHIPNGGYRLKAEAARMKKQGVKAGVPDIFLPAARGKKHGLYIELKAGKNKTSQPQEEWIEALEKLGYTAVVCYGWEEAAKAIVKYLSVFSPCPRCGHEVIFRQIGSECWIECSEGCDNPQCMKVSKERAAELWNKYWSEYNRRQLSNTCKRS